MKVIIGRIAQGIAVVWTIAQKDILDALKNRLVLSLLITAGFMALFPRMFPLIIDPPYTSIVVYDAGSSSLLLEMEDSDRFRVERAGSIEELKEIIANFTFGMGTELGLVVPIDFDEVLQAGEEPELESFVSWTNRHKAARLGSEAERQISDLLGVPVHVHIEGNIVSPPLEQNLGLMLITITSISVIFFMGILLVPNLIFEEKQSGTLQALLVSPANIGQVFLGKVLAGWFYMLLTAGVVFVAYWTAVVHWELAFLFTLCSGLFSIAVGLVLGSFFESQQEVTGWISVIIVVLIGAMLANMMGLQMPEWIQGILPWTPSVILNDIFRTSLSGSASIPQIWAKLGVLLVISLVLYGIAIWRVRRSDR
jgi:ABC-2 type transport system permease protein